MATVVCVADYLYQDISSMEHTDSKVKVNETCSTLIYMNKR